MNTCPYRPLGTRVILRVIPVENKSGLFLPDGKTHSDNPQTYEVVAIGGEVNDEKFSLNVGETVLASFHPSEAIGLSKENQWFMVDRSKVVAALETQTQN